MAEPELERALTDDDYRESLVSSLLPLARFLRRAGAYYQAAHEEIDYADWNGAIVGRGPGREIRAAILPDPTLPYTELAPLLELGTFARELVARHPTTPLAVLTKLADDEHWMVRNAITSRPDAAAVLATLSPEVVARLKGAPAVAYTPPTHEELRAKVLTGDQATRCSVTAAPSLPEDLMLLLAADPDHDVRRHLACRRDITTAVTEVLLAQACDGRTLQTLATNASLPTATLAALAQKEPLQEDRGPGWFARRIRSPWPTSSGDVRALLAARSGLPSEWLETFARDADWQVRAAVAANPDSSEALLDSLLDDEQSSVRLELARNPRFSSLELLATDPEPSVCLALAHRADLPAETLELLARDANAGVRAAIASRKDTPRALLEVLLRDSQAQVRQAANTALGAEPVLTPFNRVPALQIRGVLLTHAPSSRATKPVPAPPPAPAKPSGSESGLRKVLEQWGIAVEPVLHVVNTVGSSNVLFGAGTLTQELQLLVPTHGDLRSSLTPKTSIPEPSTLLIKYRGSAPPCVALVIGGPTTLRAAIVEVSPQGNADAWHAVLDGLPPFSIENRIRYVSEARGAVTCSFGTRTDVESEATFSAALENLAQRLGLDQAWRGVYAEAGAGTGVSVTTECTPNGLSRQLSLRFGGTNWDRAIDLVGALVDKPATRSAAVRMGTIAGSLGVEELRNIEVVLSTGAADLIAWFPGSA